MLRLGIEYYVCKNISLNALRDYFGPFYICTLYNRESKLTCCARSLESLVEGHNFFKNQFVEIPRKSISFGKRRFKSLTI